MRVLQQIGKRLTSEGPSGSAPISTAALPATEPAPETTGDSRSATQP